jgi:hypothetical protein
MTIPKTTERKKEKKVVVSLTYFELLARKARLLDQMVHNAHDGIAVSVENLKEQNQIERAWIKADADRFIDTETPYGE